MVKVDFKEMIIQCMDVDFQNIGENGFKTIDDIFHHYKQLSDSEVFGTYEEYYGFEDEDECYDVCRKNKKRKNIEAITPEVETLEVEDMSIFHIMTDEHGDTEMVYLFKKVENAQRVFKEKNFKLDTHFIHKEMITKSFSNELTFND